MSEMFGKVTGWSFPVVVVVLIILAATRRELKGRGWLILYLAVQLAVMLFWRIPELLSSLRIDGPEGLGSLYHDIRPWLSVLQLGAYCMLIPYILVAGSGRPSFPAEALDASSAPSAAGDGDGGPRGIGGWLILPAIGLILGIIGSLIGIVVTVALLPDIPSRYQGAFVLNLAVDAGLTIFVIYGAVRFFGKRRNAPGVMIALMITQIVASLLLLGVSIGAEVQPLAMEQAKALVGGIIGAIIWIPYFSVSKRVKRTFIVP